jgi:hypothetical protein
VQEPHGRKYSCPRHPLSFESRDELLRAALARSEQVATDEVIRSAEAAPIDPREKAQLLFSWVTASSAEHPGQLRLLASADHPDVRAALDRATRRRIDYVEPARARAAVDSSASGLSELRLVKQA